MHRTYTLVQSIYGLREHVDRVVTIPAGAEVEYCVTEGQHGITLALWDGDPIRVFHEDVVYHGVWTDGSWRTEAAER